MNVCIMRAAIAKKSEGEHTKWRAGKTKKETKKMK